jgi:hypothetical protein
MSALSDIETRLRDLAADALPVIHDSAETIDRLAQSKVVAEIIALTGPLDPDLDEALASVVRGAAAAAEKIAELTAPPPDTPAGVDAEPEPGDPPA